MVYSTSRPTFKFETIKRRTNKGIVYVLHFHLFILLMKQFSIIQHFRDHEQSYDDAAKELLAELLEQQFSHQFHMHHGGILE